MNFNKQVMESDTDIIDLFDEDGNREYYTAEEFMENFRVAINDHYGYEVIKMND